MAKKETSKTTPQDATRVTRIKVADSGTDKKAEKSSQKSQSPKSRNIFVRIGGYFKGAWQELRQVRWPNRKATWSLTLAVILFSVMFTVIILLLDALFKFVFETAIG